MKCCVIGCKLEKEDYERTSFHSLIREGKLMEDWVHAIRSLNRQSLDMIRTKRPVICSNHFERKYVLYYGANNRIAPGAVPTIFPNLLREETENMELIAPSVEDDEHDSVAIPSSGEKPVPSASSPSVNPPPSRLLNPALSRVLKPVPSCLFRLPSSCSLKFVPSRSSKSIPSRSLNPAPSLILKPVRLCSPNSTSSRSSNPPASRSLKQVPSRSLYPVTLIACTPKRSAAEKRPLQKHPGDTHAHDAPPKRLRQDCNGTSFDRITLATEQFKKVCRTCLCETTDNNLENYLLPTKDSKMSLLTIREILEISTGIKIDTVDCLPNHICNECLKKVKMAYKFRLQCQRIDESLKGFLVAIDVVTENEIKPSAEDLIATVKVEKVDEPMDTTMQIDQYQVTYLGEPDNPTATGEDDLENIQPEQSTPTGKKKLYRCGVCFREYTFRNGLHDHIRIAHVQKKEQHCQICGRGFRSVQRMHLHRMRNCAKPGKTSIVDKDPWQAVINVKEDNIDITNFQCAICDETIELESDFLQHVQSHVNEKTCKYCNKTVSRPSQLESHVRSHCKVKPYACPFCLKVFTASSRLRAHIKPYSERQAQTCKKCDTVFCTMKDYLKHYNAHVMKGELGLDESMPKEPEGCSIDGVSSKDTESNNSSEAVEETLEPPEEPTAVVIVKEERMDDEEIVNVKEEHEDHSKFVIMNEPLSEEDEDLQQIEAFNKIEFKAEPEDIRETSDTVDVESEKHEQSTSATKEGVMSKMHITSEDEESLKIGEDGNSTSNEILDERVIYGSFACPDAACKMEFKYFRDVINHYTSQHCIYPPFTCTVCQQKFLLKTEVRIHLKKHIKCEYRCTYCPRYFWIFRDLKNHLRTHTGERPFKCSMCPQRFKQRPALRVHIQTHNITKEYKCKYCNKEFFSYNGMFLHQKSHMEIKDLQCKGCNKQFATQSRLKRHLSGACGLVIPRLTAEMNSGEVN